METAQPTDVALLAEIVAAQEAIATADFDLDAVLHEVVVQAHGLTGADAAFVEMVEGEEPVCRAAAGAADALATGARSEMVVPLKHGEAAPHMLKVFSQRPSAFGEREHQVLQILASSLGAAIVRGELLERLSRANDELRTLDRLKDEFVALVSHELRTPLTSVIGYVRALLGGRAGVVPRKQRALLEVVERNASRLVNLVADVLLAAKADAGRLEREFELEPLRLDTLAAHSVQTARQHAERVGISVELDACGQNVVRGDRIRLAQLLDNLLSNAIKFTPRGGTVGVRARTEGDSVLLEVSDTGVGIPAAEQADLFKRFYRTSAAAREGLPGIGLGLSVAKTIVDLHGGSIEVESAEGTGSTFRVRLPLERAGRAAA